MVPNSGAGAFSKGDVKGDLFLIEAKTKMKQQQSFSIKEEWIDKLMEETYAMGRPYWALAFNFGGYDNPDNLYVINQELFNRLQEFLRMEEQANDQRRN